MLKEGSFNLESTTALKESFASVSRAASVSRPAKHRSPVERGPRLMWFHSSGFLGTFPLWYRGSDVVGWKSPEKGLVLKGRMPGGLPPFYVLIHTMKKPFESLSNMKPGNAWSSAMVNAHILP